MTDKQIGKLIGLACRAGKLRSGEFSVEESVKTGRSKLCILASDASEKTKKHVHDMCSYRDIAVYDSAFTKDELGHWIGRDERSAVTIEDSGLAEHILELTEGGNACGK